MASPENSYHDLKGQSRSRAERRRRPSLQPAQFPESPPRRTNSDFGFQSGQDSHEDESMPLLMSRHDKRRAYTASSSTPTQSFPRVLRNEYSNSDKLRLGYSHSRSSTFAAKLTQAFRSERKPWYRVGSGGHSTPSYVDERLWYDQFTSIDWVQDSIADAARHKELHTRRGFRSRLIAWFDGIEGWILSGLVGLATAIVAYLIDASETALFDVKFGHCTLGWFMSRKSCCAKSLDCKNWISWSDSLSLSNGASIPVDFFAFTLFLTIMAVIPCLLVLNTKTVLPHNASMAAAADQPLHAEASATWSGRPKSASKHAASTFYPAAGSGVAEVRVILSGFIMHGFLGAKILIVKSIGTVLSVSSGLSVGKEGPLVHIATCIGNILSRMFSKYRRNAGKRREILSASAAAGIAVAFGSPLGGVLFSLEEVSYYFPSKTLFRTFFCSIVAAVALKFLNPYGTNKIVLFRVSYSSDWKAFEMVLFVILGLLGGGAGALFIKASRLWTRTFRQLSWIQRWPLLEVVLVAITSGALSYWNRYTTLPPAELLFEVASECTTLSESRSGLCPSRKEIPGTIKYLALALVVRTFLTVIAYGAKVPSGIYIPAMVIGGLLGRMVGHATQYVIMTYSDNSIFGSCTADGNPESCVVPGVYALVAAGSMMCGVTRLSVTLVVILFELTGSLDHVLPFSIAILVAKWFADALEPLSIYDLFTELSQYPFLDNKTRPVFAGEIGDITTRSRSIRIIDISSSPVMQASRLRDKLEHLQKMGEIDGAFPIVRDGMLVGLIPAPDLEFALDRLDDEEQQQCLMSPLVQLQGNEEDEPIGEDLTDFRAYIDPSPIALDIHSSMELAYELFVKLGVRYICVIKEGYYYGLMHKKAFVKYARDVKHESRSGRFDSGKGCLSSLREQFRMKPGK